MSWTSIDPNTAFDFARQFPRKVNEPCDFPVAQVVPDKAKEILVFAWLRISGAVNPTADIYYKVYVNGGESSPDAAFYLYSYGDANWNTETVVICENFWLPMPVDRKIKVVRLPKLDANNDELKSNYMYSQLRVVGYR